MTSANKDGDRKKPHPKGRNTPSSRYVRSVLALYSALPHTPARPRPDDRFVVSRLEKQKQPLLRVQAALLLGTARRIFRPDDADPLMPIRSIRFFLPIIDELQHAHLDQGYLNYLDRKLSDFLGTKLTLNFSDARSDPNHPRPPTPRPRSGATAGKLEPILLK